MPQYRNITDETLFVVTERDLVKVEPDSILTVSDDFAKQVYFQTGETGEPKLWAAVAAPSKKSTTAQPTPADEKE